MKAEIDIITSIPESPICKSFMYVETFKIYNNVCDVMVNNFTKYQHSEHSSLTEHKQKTMTYNVGNSGHGFGQEQKCGRVYIYIVDILVNIIPQYKQYTVYK